MSIINTVLSNPGIGVKTVTGTFETDAVAALTTTTSGANAVAQANIGVAASAGFSGRYVSWPLGGAGGLVDGIIAVLGSFTGTTMAIQSPGLLAATAAGTVLSRWEQLLAVGSMRAVTITAANGDKWEWAAGDEPMTVRKTASGGSPVVIEKAMIVTPGQIHFAPGVLPASTTFTITATIDG